MNLLCKLLGHKWEPAICYRPVGEPLDRAPRQCLRCGLIDPKDEDFKDDSIKNNSEIEYAIDNILRDNRHSWGG